MPLRMAPHHLGVVSRPIRPEIHERFVRVRDRAEAAAEAALAALRPHQGPIPKVEAP